MQAVKAVLITTLSCTSAMARQQQQQPSTAERFLQTLHNHGETLSGSLDRLTLAMERKIECSEDQERLSRLEATVHELTMQMQSFSSVERVPRKIMDLSENGLNDDAAVPVFFSVQSRERHSCFDCPITFDVVTADSHGAFDTDTGQST